MRGIGNHEPPVIMQPAPNDNTSAFVDEQIDAYRRTGTVVHTEVAREIAAWWQAPGGDGLLFAAFASTGTLSAMLPAAILDELRSTTGWQDARSLLALLAYTQSAVPTSGQED